MKETAKERTERLKGKPMFDIIKESHVQIFCKCDNMQSYIPPKGYCKNCGGIIDYELREIKRREKAIKTILGTLYACGVQHGCDKSYNSKKTKEKVDSAYTLIEDWLIINQKEPYEQLQQYKNDFKKIQEIIL